MDLLGGIGSCCPGINSELYAGIRSTAFLGGGGGLEGGRLPLRSERLGFTKVLSKSSSSSSLNNMLSLRTSTAISLVISRRVLLLVHLS